MNSEFEKNDDDHRPATRADVLESELRLQKEIWELEIRIQKTISKMDVHMEGVHAEIIKTKSTMFWFGIAAWLSLAAMLAKGFGWI